MRESTVRYDQTCSCPCPPPCMSPGQTLGLPIAMDSMATDSFCQTNVPGRTLVKKSVSSSDALVFAGGKYKWTALRANFRAAWVKAFPQVPYPDEMPELGFKFLPMLFAIYGGYSANTQTELERHTRRAAKRQWKSTTRFFNSFYSRISCCIWSANAQRVTLRKPRSVVSM